MARLLETREQAEAEAAKMTGWDNVTIHQNGEPSLDGLQPWYITAIEPISKRHYTWSTDSQEPDEQRF